MKSIITTIHNCARCNNNHVDIEFLPLSNNNNLYSHFAMCPEVNQPILMSIVDENEMKEDNKSRNITCVHCFSTIAYTPKNTSQETLKEYWEYMVEHEQQCNKNPLVIKNRQLQQALQEVLNSTVCLWVYDSKAKGWKTSCRTFLYYDTPDIPPSTVRCISCKKSIRSKEDLKKYLAP